MNGGEVVRSAFSKDTQFSGFIIFSSLKLSFLTSYLHFSSPLSIPDLVEQNLAAVENPTRTRWKDHERGHLAGRPVHSHDVLRQDVQTVGE